LLKEKAKQKKTEGRVSFKQPSPVLRIEKDGVITYSNEAGKLLLEAWKAVLEEKFPQMSRKLAKSSPEKKI
jgi:uncharacterized protein (UPF0218 family)